MSNFSRRKPNKRDERKDHGALDESSSEQQLCELADYTLIVTKNWSTRPRATGSYRRKGRREGGSERDKIWVDFKSFKILENLNYSKFSLHNEARYYYSISYAF